MPKTLYLIDGHAQVYRAFHAVEGLTSPDGRPTGAAYGFTRMLLDLVRRHHPDHLVAVFDAPGKTFRHERYPDYKATRKPTPPELLQQIPVIQDIVKAYSIPVFSLSGWEADDLLGALAMQGAAAGVDVVLVTGDKDCGQLLSERIRMYDPRKDVFTTVESFTEKKGLPPEKLVDLMGLWGDTSDNIPGVPGIGQKIGTSLILKYGSLDQLLHHAAEVKGKRGEKLRECKDLALLSRELATIRTDAPVRLDLTAAATSRPDRDELARIFQDLGFRSLLRELNEGAVKKEEKRGYVLVDSPERFKAFMKALKKESHLSVDTETTSRNPMLAQLVGISISWEARSGYYLPFRAPEGSSILGAEQLKAIGTILEDPTVTKTGQNLKYDMIVLRRAGIHLAGVTFDSLLASTLLDGHLRDHDLDSLALRHLDLVKIPTKDLIGTGKKQITMDQVPVEKVCEYACEDADVAWRLEEALDALLQKRDERYILDEIELPLLQVLADTQMIGIRVDRELLARLSDEISLMLNALTEEIHSLAGHEFNIASPKQLAQVLFEEMDLPVIRKTKTGPSTDEAVLTELAARGHELPDRVLYFRKYAKLKNTYLDALPALIHPETGRLHTTLSQTTTATGRLSSREPNLQNIPVRTDKGHGIRAAFVPADGWQMLAADYSQVELRMVAHYSDDNVLRQAFAEEQDIHRVVAAEVNAVDPEDVTPEQRSAAKAINFGIIYGQRAHGLSQATGMSFAEAQDFIDSYFARFPQVKGWIDKTITQAHADGFVRTLRGRRRQIPELASSNRNRRSAAEREAVNTVIQGSAADLIKIAMINIHQRMPEATPTSRMLLQIHDELLFEAPLEEIDQLKDLVREEMEGALSLSVPLRVDMGVGPNWLEAK